MVIVSIGLAAPSSGQDVAISANGEVESELAGFADADDAAPAFARVAPPILRPSADSRSAPVGVLSTRILSKGGPRAPPK